MSFELPRTYRFTEAVMFQTKTLEDVRRVRFRPLDGLSDFVVERLPYLLEELRQIKDPGVYLRAVSDLVDVAEREVAIVLKKKTWKTIEADLQKTALASLDIAILWNAIAHLGHHPTVSESERTRWQRDSVTRTPNLQRLLVFRGVTTQQPNILTYQDIVRSNPDDDVRTFTTANLGHTEACFYRLHAQIEETLEEVTTHLDQVLNLFFHSRETRFIQIKRRKLLLDARHKFVGCVAQMGRFMAMKARDFHAFRPYLSSHHGLQGASGVFSDGFARLDLFMFGHFLPSEHLSGCETHLRMGYFGRRGGAVGEAFQSAEQGRSVVAAALATEDEEFINETLSWVEAILAFRTSHFRAVAKKLPDVVNNSASGTGMERGSGDFLRGRIATVRRVKKTLEQKLISPDSRGTAREFGGAPMHQSRRRL
jgi:hypothetical protein